MELIPNYELNGSSNDGNAVFAVRNDSSNRKRLDATYTRKFSAFNAKTGVYSVPQTSVFVRRDVSDGAGNPSGQRASGQVEFRLPVMATEADLDALLEDIRAYVNSPSLKGSILKQLVPTAPVRAA